MYNLYIDESCHLENDKKSVMCIGYTKVLTENYLTIKEDIKQIKLAYKTPTEIKWNTVSLSRLPLYKALIDYFFEKDIDFRCVLIKYKDKLEHQKFNNGSHDTFYYKMVFFLLKSATNPPANEYKVYLDIKDTRGKEKLHAINEVLHNEYSKTSVPSPFIYFQHIHSHENVLLQLTDLFIGAITFKSQGHHLKENANKAKVEIVNYLETKSGYFLNEGTEPWETKFNIFDHQPKGK
jgi:hypothetical protein